MERMSAAPVWNALGRKGFARCKKKKKGVSPASMGVAGELRAVVRRGRDGGGVLMVGGAGSVCGWEEEMHVGRED